MPTATADIIATIAIDTIANVANITTASNSATINGTTNVHNPAITIAIAIAITISIFTIFTTICAAIATTIVTVNDANDANDETSTDTDTIATNITTFDSTTTNADTTTSTNDTAATTTTDNTVLRAQIEQGKHNDHLKVKFMEEAITDDTLLLWYFLSERSVMVMTRTVCLSAGCA